MKRLLRENWLTILLLTLIIAAYVLLRTPGDELASTAEFDERAQDGRPILVQFYANT